MGRNSKGMPILVTLRFLNIKVAPEGSMVNNQQQVNWMIGEMVLALMKQGPAI